MFGSIRPLNLFLILPFSYGGNEMIQELYCPLLQEGGHGPPIVCRTQIGDGSKLIGASITKSDRSVSLVDCERYNCRTVPRHYARIKVNGTKARIKVNDDQVTMTLEIHPVRRTDEGSIACDVQMKDNVSFSRQCDISVIAVPEKPGCSYHVTSSQVSVTCTTAKVFPRAGCVWTLNFREIQSPIVSETPRHNEFYVKGVRYYRTTCSCKFKVQGSGRYKVNVLMYPILTDHQVPDAEAVVSQQLDITIDEASIEYFVFSYIYGNESQLTSSTGLSSRVICQTSGNPEPEVALYFKNHLGELTKVKSVVGQLLDYLFQPTQCPFMGHLICTAYNSLNARLVYSTIQVNCSQDYCDTATATKSDTSRDDPLEIELCVRSTPRATQFYLQKDNKQSSKDGKSKHDSGISNVTAVTDESDTALVKVSRRELRGHQWLRALGQSISFPVLEFNSQVEDADLDNNSEDLPRCPSNLQMSESSKDGQFNLKWMLGRQNQTYAVHCQTTPSDKLNTSDATQEFVVANVTSLPDTTPQIVSIVVENDKGRVICPYWIVDTSIPEVNEPSCRTDPVAYSVAIILASLWLLLVCVLSVNKTRKRRMGKFGIKASGSRDQSPGALDTNESVAFNEGQNVEQTTVEVHQENIDSERRPVSSGEDTRVRHASVFPRVFYRMGSNMKTFQEHLNQNFLNSYFNMKVSVAPRDKGEVSKTAADFYKTPNAIIDCNYTEDH